MLKAKDHKNKNLGDCTAIMGQNGGYLGEDIILTK